MSPRSRSAVAVILALLILQGPPALAQWGYPGGFGGFGWDGWGGGVGTHEGDVARGLGVFAMGLGQYNTQTAVADSINADTVMRWNEYVYQSQMHINRQRRERMSRDRARTIQAFEAAQKRLRDNPESRDVLQGDALNVALDEINDPRVYVGTLPAAKAKVGGENIRAIPFRYGAAAITVGLHQLATGALPPPLRTSEFEAEREALKTLDEQIARQIEEDKEPDPATVKRLLATIYAAEEKAARILSPNSLERKQADRYFKALHGLVVMLKAPSIDEALAGVEKHPDATVGELLNFMTSFNLRFGPAVTPPQRQAYVLLYPQLVKLRDEASRTLAGSPLREAGATAAENFFSSMTYEDLQKKAPKP